MASLDKNTIYFMVGEKIKKIVYALTVISCIGCIITGIVLMAVLKPLWWIGFLTLILGPVLSVLMSFPMYGFGELIAVNHAILDELKKTSSNTSDNK